MTDMRAEMVGTMTEMGITMEKHHHEVAPSQNELGNKFDELLSCADGMQKYKYVVHMVAHSYGKTATFMPKPIIDDNGSGMHCHQSLWKDSKPLFAGGEYSGLSETALHYIGGIIKHAKAINAFTNSTTNSYKRLVPGFEAPTILAYSARNRSASIRIPFAEGEKAKRIEVRFPDAASNPYLAFSAMLMAGLDGVKNKIHPGDAIDFDLYEASESQLKNLSTVATSLEDALDSLEKDHDFLIQDGVFTKDQISGYIDLKREEVSKLNNTTHPIEFDMYYSV
jgi:glutamine synthetase